MLYLEHVGICAKDTKSLKDWYVKYFNLEIVYDNKKENPTFILKFKDGGMLEIYAAESFNTTCDNKHQGIRHLAFATDDIEGEYERLKHEVFIEKELSENNKGVKTFFLRDLEGNLIHYIQRPTSL
ncbi:VOC family protein [Lutispora sp.]|uniref:VOC family protein n=1 Tax=Lutispora sp. TaxID=2828727 RepID=UPI003568C911